MNKILIAGLMLLMPYVTNALDMCVRDSAMVVSLDPAVGGSSNKKNASEMTWSVTFSYGTIYGEATCLFDADGKPSDISAGVYTNERGEMLANDDTFVQRKDGGYCWCRMTHPALSRWVYAPAWTGLSVANCVANCVEYCTYHITGNYSMRSGLFGSVGK